MPVKGKFTIHGARGSLPVSGPAFRRYGGYTSCLSLETEEGVVVVDAGTGIASLWNDLSRRQQIPPVTILLTHLHLDHMAGLTALPLFHRKGVQVTLLADSAVFKDWPGAVKTLVGRPFWPVSIRNSEVHVRIGSLPKGKSTLWLYGVRIERCLVRHPQGCLSYKLRLPGQTVVLASDREVGDPGLDAAFLEFCRGADVLIHDAQYTPEEYPRRIGWGHSTWKMAAQVARAGQVGRLLLTSHDPFRSDEEVDRLVEKARRAFPHTAAAAEGLTWTPRGTPAQTGG